MPIATTVRRILSNIGFPAHKATKCGHWTTRKGFVTAFGETITTTMPIQKDGTVEWCLSCLQEMAIQCGWCQNAIMIGDPVTLSAPDSVPHFHKNLIVVPAGSEVVIGCLRETCGLASEVGGYWVPGEDGKGTVTGF